MPRNKSHLKRLGTTRGFSLHYRYLGVSLPKMDRWIKEHHSTISSIIIRNIRGHAFNAQMGAKAIARGDYRPDRALDLSGVAAYDREKEKCMKDLGLITKDKRITQRMRKYIQALEYSQDTIPLLRDYGIRIKLQGPQIIWRHFKPGQRQMGYAHYRIRPLVMFLYSIHSARNHKVTLNTDDIALSAFRIFTPQQVSRVDEDFLMGHIDDYFARKAASEIDHKKEFQEQFKQVQQELRTILTDKYAFHRKCRNAANEVYCTSLFLKWINVISTQESIPPHWSATRMTYEKTGPVPYYKFSLTNVGRKQLKQALDRIPVWGRDIIKLFPTPQEQAQAINTVNRLARGQAVKTNEVTSELLKKLSALELKLIKTDNKYTVDKLPDFELQYDLG